jgi:hypothetical protein
MNTASSTQKEERENDSVFVGRKGHAIDFFEDYQEEFIKYAKTKGMVALSEVKTAIELARDHTPAYYNNFQDSADIVWHNSDEQIIKAITKEQKIK